MNSKATRIDHDWYPGVIPSNVEVGQNVYLDSSYAFTAFLSRREHGLTLGDASGAYDRASFVVGPNGSISVGPYTCLNGAYLICHDRMTIGAHCLLSWGVVLTDSAIHPGVSVRGRRAVLQAAAQDSNRWLPAISKPRPVVVEDNVWIGFDAVVLPGATLGHGCIIGCKTVVTEDIPPYAVVAGNPFRIVRHLDPDDTPAAREHAMKDCIRG